MAKRLLKYVLGICLLMGVSAGWAPSVRAEFVVDLYGGLAMTEDSDVQVRVSDVPFSGTGGTLTSETLKENGKFKDSFTVGGRVTYWTQRFPWLGVAFDGSYFKADAKNANIEIPVYGFSFLMMMRYPLLPNENPTLESVLNLPSAKSRLNSKRMGSKRRLRKMREPLALMCGRDFYGNCTHSGGSLPNIDLPI
jgi:hypothetical protein